MGMHIESIKFIEPMGMHIMLYNMDSTHSRISSTIVWVGPDMGHISKLGETWGNCWYRWPTFRRVMKPHPKDPHSSSASSESCENYRGNWSIQSILWKLIQFYTTHFIWSMPEDHQTIDVAPPLLSEWFQPMHSVDFSVCRPPFCGYLVPIWQQPRFIPEASHRNGRRFKSELEILYDLQRYELMMAVAFVAPKSGSTLTIMRWTHSGSQS